MKPASQNIDFDIEFRTRNELKKEVILLRNKLRQIRDYSGHDLCWYNPEIWEALPEKTQPSPEIPNWCDFIKNCAEFRNSLEEKNVL